ncbi:MAG TPA: EAL domain-containing protein [Pseudonocardiaceae bacterium]|nr:EAL domain-containing protein [Pseudonocardiaceae bacterium]
MGSDSPESPVRSAAARLRLAHEWAYVLSSTTYIPLRHDEIERRLLDLVERLCATLLSEPFAPAAGGEIGAALVGLNCTGETSLWRSIELLGNAVLSDHEDRQDAQDTDRLIHRMVGVLGAVASGYTSATRELILRQQETMNQALLKAARDTQQRLAASQARFDELFLSSASGIAITDLDGRFIRTNGALGEILGYSPTEFTELSVYQLIDPADVPSLRQAHRDLLDGTATRPRLRPGLLRRDGELARLPLTVSPLRGADGRPSHYAVIVEDDSDTELLARQLSQQILHDLKTKLPNRQYFTSAIERKLRHADPRAGVTLYHLDIDGFSLLNGSLGPPAGDEVLQHVADALRSAFAEEKAMVARVGGDEFAILIQNSPDTPDVVTMVDRIHESLAEPVYIRGHGVAPSVSVGVVHRPPADIPPTELFRAADLTLRRAKSRGCGQWALFDAEQDAAERERLDLAAGMPGAWENGEIRVVCRPVVRLADRAAIGVEAGFRWEHRKFGVIGHDRCVALAEETGLIMPLGGWLLRSACERLADRAALPVSVPLARSQCTDPDLVSKVLRMAHEYTLPPNRLRLGLPARAVAAHRDEAAENVRLLADAGIAVTLHDFGGTVDDLTCLEDVTVDAVRLAPGLADRQKRCADEDSLIARVSTNLVETARMAGASVLVGDIETSAAADWWRRRGCDLGCGPLYDTHLPD